MSKAVVLLSGGLDSTTCLALANAQGYDCYAISFNYYQRHQPELIAAKKIATDFKVKEHHIIDIPIHQFGHSALTDLSLSVPDYSEAAEIPSTYVPARNTIFLSFAIGYAEVLKAYDIFIGVSSIDYSHYPDCRPAYYQAFQTLANLATKEGVEGKEVRIHTPIIYLTKAQTIKLGKALGIDYRMTVSCYQANEEGLACGKCASCYLRKKGFTEAELADETRYQATTTPL